MADVRRLTHGWWMRFGRPQRHGEDRMPLPVATGATAENDLEAVVAM